MIYEKPAKLRLNRLNPEEIADYARVKGFDRVVVLREDDAKIVEETVIVH